MVLTGKGRLEPHIWLETPEQAEFTKDMIRPIWGKERIGDKARCPPLAKSQDLWVRPTAMAILLLIET